MKVQIRDADAFRALNPYDLAAYLRTTRWREVETKPEHSSLWVRKVNGEEAKVLLPLSRAFRDFALRMADVVAMVAAVEDRSQLEILADVQEASTDVIRIRLSQADATDGSVPLERGVELIENAREMMRAAACAAVEPRARFGARKPEAANEYVRAIRLGQTERGSYVVKVLSRVPPALRSARTLFGELEEPFERKVVQVLGKALRALRMASDQAMASGRFDAFAPIVRAGVSSNLCEALVNMAGAAQPADELVVSWTWARSRPAEPEAVREVCFPGDRLPVIAEAGRHYRASAPPEAAEIRGLVVKLQRDDGQGPPAGPVTILAVIDGALRKVNVTLAEEDHRLAVQAYERGASVTCMGDLTREGNQFVLQNPRGFTVSAEE